MEHRLSELERKDIADALKQICIVSDIDAPEDFAAVINYMQRKFKTTLKEIEQSMDFWIMNESKINKPRRLNVKFVSDVISFYRAHTRARTHERQKSSKNTYTPTPEELAAINTKGYKLIFEEFYFSIKTNQTKMLLKMLEVNCDFAVSRGWVKRTWTDEELEQEIEWLRAYAKRYHQNLHEKEDNIYKRLQAKFVDKTDYNKCAVMSLHFRYRISQGHVPETYQNNPIEEL